MSGSATAAIAAGVVAIGAIGAGAWYLASQEDGIPELSPGSVTTTEVAAAPLSPALATPTAPAALPEPQITDDLPTRVEPPRAMREEPRATPRSRPAAAPSAEDVAVNASATVTLPEGPQPYTSLTASAAPATVNPQTIDVPPNDSAVPAPSEAPQPIPATPPISFDPTTSPGQDLTAPQNTSPPLS